MPSDALSDFCDAHLDRFDAIVDRFVAYQPRSVSMENLRRWLRSFDPKDYNIALRLLEAVEYYDHARIDELLRALHKQVRSRLSADGFNALRTNVFVAMGKAGESGVEVQRRYRNANGVAKTSALLAYVQDIPQLLYETSKEGRKCALVFLDDFIGSGDQIKTYWETTLSQLIPLGQPLYLATMVATPNGLDVVTQNTPFEVITVHHVLPRYMLPTCGLFSGAERDVIRDYSRKMGNTALGFGGLELMIAFAHDTPDNTLSMLRGGDNQKRWPGILPRYDDLN